MKSTLQVAILSALYGGAAAQTGLASKAYSSLPLTSIKPTGWLMDQLQVQMNGLAGHEHEFYNYVSNTDWMGGTSAYSSLEEAGSYWFNAMVPAGILSNNAAINQRTSQFMDYVLSHQDTDGWLGPEVGTNKPRYLWGRYPFFFGAIQMMEANPSLVNSTVPKLHKFVQNANAKLKAEGQPEAWTATRWEDFVITLQWLYDNFPQGNEDVLIETMKLLKSTGDPWESVFNPQFFPKDAVDNIRNPFPVLTWHGVNMAEGLKALPSTYRFTHNQSDITAASTGWDLLFQYHGRPSGIYGADEYLAGKKAVRGTELCLVVETMFSGSYLFQVIGDSKFLDRVERITYNALPATLTGDMWSRQYLQQQNQVAAKNMTPNPFVNDGPYSNVFGLEPNYPCCTVNHPQGWPKFITNSFVVSPDKSSLRQAYLGPFQTTTTLANNNKVSVTVDTIYPFSDTLKTSITAGSAFKYYVRIPSWVQGGTIALNGAAAKALSPSGGFQEVDVSAGTTSFTLQLPSPVTTESRPNNSIAIHRGAFNYAFDIPRTPKVLAQNSKQPLAKDLEFDANATWQYAIDPKTAVYNYDNSKLQNGALPSPIFDSALSPMSITVTACQIDWKLAGDTFASDPPSAPKCVGSAKNITLTPLGTTKLRISEFPVVSLA